MSTGGSTPRSSRRITGVDVAREANVDPAVVSKLLSGDHRLRVADETRKRVTDAVNKLGYRPNYAAQRLRTNRPMSAVGLIIPNFSNAAYAEIIHGAEKAAHDRNVVLFVASAEEAGSFRALVEDLVASDRVDGILIAGGTSIDVERVNEYLTDRGVPYLFLNRKSSGLMRSLFMDDEYAIELAVRHLVELGHKHIYSIAGRKTLETGLRRQAAFKYAMRNCGLPFKKSLIVEEDYSPVGGKRGLDEIIKRDPTATAIVASEFVMAVGALNAAREANIKVPLDLSIVAFNNLPIATLLNPTLTTVGLALGYLGEQGFDLLLSTPHDVEVDQTVSMRAALYPRESSAPPKNTTKRSQRISETK
jgi:LacI family transcriptional regulator